MKTIFLIIFAILANSKISNAQILKDFSVEKHEKFIVKPKYLSEPDFTKSCGFYILDQKYMGNLVDSVKKAVIPDSTRFTPGSSQIMLCFNESGKIFYAYLFLNKNDVPGEKIPEKDLRKIIDGFMKIKIDMSKIDTNYETNNKKFEFGILTLPLRKKNTKK
ncbi:MULTISPECIES: hypothetical protein [Butyricimonas]|uniref:hypothetical protein n=1 Tax=Butyricimonas TaxID=574697 RepID=UPI0007FB565C|nr:MULTISPECIES: hypothetical protein [Butyricimonas]